MAESASVSGRARPSGARARGELIASAPLAAFGVLSERYAGPGESEDAVRLEAGHLRMRPEAEFTRSRCIFFNCLAIV